MSVPPSVFGLSQAGLYLPMWDLGADINGQSDISINHLSTKIASYGRLASAALSTSLIKLTEPGPDQINISDLTNPPNGNALTDIRLNINGSNIFGGNYLHGLYSIHSDTCTLYARDYAGKLFDTKISLVALSAGYTNKTVNDFVAAIASQYGYSANIGSTEGASVKVGDIATIANGIAVNNRTPRPLWEFLVFLARQVGANLFVNSSNVLTFIDAGANAVFRKFAWGGTPSDYFQTNALSGCYPIEELEFLHQPQRNNNFSVVIISHHAKSATINSSSVFIQGQPIQSVSGSQKAGTYVGSAGQKMSSVLSASGLGIPVYQYRIPELTQDQCAQIALGRAMDIASRLVVVTMKIRGDTSVKPLDQIQLLAGSASASPDIYGFANRQYYVTSVEHMDSVNQGSEVTNEGFTTIIKALTVPPTQQSDDNDLGGAS